MDRIQDRSPAALSHGAEITRELAKNALARLLGPLRERRSRLGIEGDPAVAVRAMTRMAPGLRALRLDAEGTRVLELGPGRTPELMVAMLLAGSPSAVGVDTSMQIPTDACEPTRYRRLLEELVRPESAAVLEAVGSSPERARQRFLELEGAPLEMSFHRYDGTRLPLADASVDLIISKSVLEHVRLTQVPALLLEMIRVLVPGGAMIHAIDLRDHLHVDGDDRVVGDWLQALRYREGLFDAMFSRRSTSINRLREPQWRSRFADAGLEVADWRTTDFPLPADLDRGRLQSPRSTMSDQELQVGFIHVAARAPA